MKEVASKTMEGISDLVVFAPIKEGFIKAFETITYASRLELVANALNKLRVAAREYERVTPYSDVTERILSLLDFRVGVIDEDLFSLERASKGKSSLRPRRYLYLTATFEGGFEPYMRQIWRPLGPFLDLLFCNCDDYITATEHSFDEYLQWVRDNQMDSAIFYNTTGITVRDQKYLSGLEKAERAWRLEPSGAGETGLSERDAVLAQFAMSYPDDDAARAKLGHPLKTVTLGFEALNVLYKLTDYFPPEWMTGHIDDPHGLDEGHRLVRATRELLRGWDAVLQNVKAAASANPPQATSALCALLLKTFEAPLEWYETGCAEIGPEAPAETPDAGSPPNGHAPFVAAEVQSGILTTHRLGEQRVSHGALLLFTVRDAGKARAFIRRLLDDKVIGFDGDPAPASRVFTNIGFTSLGLLELGMPHVEHDWLPKEFREGLAQRSSQVGDMRENHPRNWILPRRNGPAFRGKGKDDGSLPPVAMDEVDFVLQLRGFDKESVEKLAHELAEAAGLSGATLEAIDRLQLQVDEKGVFRDYFGFADGISQPKPKAPGAQTGELERDKVALGEVLLGYPNDRQDGWPMPFCDLDNPNKPPGANTAWRKPYRARTLDLLKNGSFLVVRKIGEEVEALENWLDEQKDAISAKVGGTHEEAKARLKAAIMGREADGAPLVSAPAANPNDFDYGADPQGLQCPFAAHIRRANPRRWDRKAAQTPARQEFYRPTPRLMRRGMLFEDTHDGSRGLMFMAYAASLAEQYEVIQRWLNGGNPTDVASANNDPLTGVRPKGGPSTFRFVAQAQNGQPVVIRAELPAVAEVGPEGSEPGRHPFTPLHWGLYLFAPSRAALGAIVSWTGGYRPLREFLEYAIGQKGIDRLQALDDREAAKEWKRLIEDFIAKDPSERDISPHVSSAIRYYYGGVLDLEMSIGERPKPEPQPESDINQDPESIAPSPDARPKPGEAPDPGKPPAYDWDDPVVETQNVILCAGEYQILQVLSEWDKFTSQEQLRRIHDKTGPIYVTQQPDNKYLGACPQKFDKLNYHLESAETDSILYSYTEEDAFKDGYLAGRSVLNGIKDALKATNHPITAFKIELRRQYIQPAIAALWNIWYGLPDGDAMEAGAWSWKKLVDTDPKPGLERSAALCPGDFMAPSRGSVFPRPSPSIDHYATAHGKALNKAGLKFVGKLTADAGTDLIKRLFAAYETQPEVLARNIVGTMIGAIPPMDANLRNIILEWLLERRLWRHQAAFKAALDGATVLERTEAVRDVLKGPIAQAMCKRPAPDLLFRTSKGDAEIPRGASGRSEKPAQKTTEGDLLVVNLASASQRRLANNPDCPDVSIIFGGPRKAGPQGYCYNEETGEVTPADTGPVHACPAQKMAMGGMTGILAALLDAGTITALPASLIVQISGWSDPPGP